MRIVITTILLIMFLLFVGHFQITLKPFSVSMPYWHRAVGMLFLCFKQGHVKIKK